MKYIIAILAFTFSTNTIFAKSNPDSLNPSEFINRLNQKKDAGSKNDRVVLTFGVDNMTYKRHNKGDSFNIKWFSPSIGAYFHIEKMLSKEFSVSPGIGFNFIQYNTDFFLKSDSANIAFVQPSAFDPNYAQAGNYKGGTFYTSYIELPVELRYRKEMKSGDFLKIAIGLKVGYNITSNFSWTALDKSAGNIERFYKMSSFKEVSDFRFGPTIRFGYSFFNIYGFYGMNKLFKGTSEKDNSDFQPFSIGISINGL
jgi:hypothetical protein